MGKFPKKTKTPLCTSTQDDRMWVNSRERGEAGDVVGDRIPDWGSVFHSDVGVLLWGMNFDFTFLDGLSLHFWNLKDLNFANLRNFGLHIFAKIICRLRE